MKIVTVVGARPQFIKAAVVSKALTIHPEVTEILVHSGQHYDENMSGVFFGDLKLRQPDYRLDIQGNSNVSMVTSLVRGMDRILEEQKPDRMLVYGDTNTTMGAALSGKINGIPVAHVEAGMRHGDLSIPEELNRVIADRVSDLLFCSTPHARNNLEKEGYLLRKCRVEVPGDVMFDAAIMYARAAEGRPLPFSSQLKNNYILCTLHRAENVDDKEKLSALLSSLDALSENMHVVFPLHPRTRKSMEKFGLSTKLQIVEPQGYLDMINLVRHCRMVITDSGGLQKEAFLFKKYALVLRKFTEWQELADHGYVIVCDTDPDAIKKGFEIQMNKPLTFHEHFYGHGDAGVKIASVLAGKS